MTKIKIPSFIDIILCNISQVMFQTNALVGALLLFGILIESWQMAIMLIFAIIIAILFANFIKLDKEMIKVGLFGFSPALLALCTCFFFGFTLKSALLILFGTLLSVILQNLGFKYKLPIFALPFMISFWIIYYLNKVNFLQKNIIEFPSTLPILDGAINGFNQIFFLQGTLSGLIFLIALSITLRKKVFLILFGSILSYIIGYIIGVPQEELITGLWSFNSVLLCLLFVEKSKLYILIGIIIAVILQRILPSLSLAAPFIISAFVTNILIDNIKVLKNLASSRK